MNCETCNKTKITISRGLGSLQSTISFAEAIHMDLVGGQSSLALTTTDSSVPAATWFLFTVDEHTSWEQSWPIYTKKTVASQIHYLLEYLKTNFGKTRFRIQANGGTEFSNTSLQEVLLSCGIK